MWAQIDPDQTRQQLAAQPRQVKSRPKLEECKNSIELKVC